MALATTEKQLPWLNKAIKTLHPKHTFTLTNRYSLYPFPHQRLHSFTPSSVDRQAGNQHLKWLQDLMSVWKKRVRLQVTGIKPAYKQVSFTGNSFLRNTRWHRMACCQSWSTLFLFLLVFLCVLHIVNSQLTYDLQTLLGLQLSLVKYEQLGNEGRESTPLLGKYQLSSTERHRWQRGLGPQLSVFGQSRDFIGWYLLSARHNSFHLCAQANTCAGEEWIIRTCGFCSTLHSLLQC